MTNNQVYNTIKMLLDDNSEVFHKDYLIDKFVDLAQMQLIRKAYSEGDERLLRPLYRVVNDIPNGGLIEQEDLVGITPFEAEIVLYPKTCLLYVDDEDYNDRRQRKLAKYIERGLYENHEYQVLDFFTTFGRLYYTLDTYRDAAISNQQSQRHIIKFNVNDTTPRDVLARFTYIKRPFKFNKVSVANPLLNYTLEIPAEYHPELCFLAVDLANGLDALEVDRGSKARLSQSGGIELGTLAI